MKILVTGGNTFVPIDKVRGITNIFKGRTACDIATECLKRGYDVSLLGNPGMEDRCCHVDEKNGEARGPGFLPYKTYDELYAMMEKRITRTGTTSDYDVVIHSAAVSDYKVARVCSPRTSAGESLPSINRDAKISSSHDRLLLELEPTEKIVDKIRDPWGFQGVLVKFKLQVDMSDGKLIEIAKKSMEDSGADIMVANCLEWARERAYILSRHEVLDVKRSNLARALIQKIEDVHAVRVWEPRVT